MALFKISKGNVKDLPTTYNDGYCYVTIDEKKMYIDTTNDSSGRICLNAAVADSATSDANGNVIADTYATKAEAVQITAQALTDEQKAQARTNIGAITADEAVAAVQEVAAQVFAPDWNAAESESGHVLNRTHWVESEMVEILPETTLTTDVPGEFLIDPPVVLEVGETYIINWLGVEYTCVGQDASAILQADAVIVGDGSRYGMTGSGEPFMIIYWGGVSPVVELDRTNYHNEVTISIHRQTETVHKLDKRFLPMDDIVAAMAEPQTLTEEQKAQARQNIGLNNIVDGSDEGAVRTITSTEESDEYTMGWCAFAEGWLTKASGQSSHAEGANTEASGRRSHAEGRSTTASGECAHSEGQGTTASGERSHAEGYGAEAFGENAHAEGCYTIASGANSHVQGRNNIEDTEGRYAHIVGNGELLDRSNAHTLDWEGNAWYAGDMYLGGTGMDDAEAKKVLTEGDMDSIAQAMAKPQTLTEAQKAQARENIGALSSDTVIPSIEGLATSKQDKIMGTAGQFVVIGDDGNVTTKTISNAEEATF